MPNGAIPDQRRDTNLSDEDLADATINVYHRGYNKSILPTSNHFGTDSLNPEKELSHEVLRVTNISLDL